MANFRSIYKIQVFLTILIHLTVALYEDQVGKFDWKRSFVGKVKFVSFEAKRIIVATEENVLATLNLNNGDIQWRQILEDPSNYQLELLHVNKDILTVSGVRNNWLVRTWNINTGTLLAEWVINAERTVPSAFTIINGKILHLVPITGSHLEITTYSFIDHENGVLKGVTRIVSAPWLTNISNCVFAGLHYVCVGSNQLHFINLDQENSKFITKPLDTFIESEAGKIILIEYKHKTPSFLMLSNNIAKLASIVDENIVIKPFDLMPNAVNVVGNGKDLIYQLEANDNKEKLIRIKVKDFQTGADEFSVDLDYPLGLGAPIILGAQNRGSSSDLLLSTTDNALLLVRLPEAKILWSREEALSNIVATEFFELPISELDASIEHEFDNENDIFGMFSHRISTQINQFYNLVFGNKLLQNSGLVRDEFGLHKIIVVATRAGKLFALDTLSGSIAWSYRLPNIQPFLGLNGQEQMLLYVQRTAQFAPLPAHCILLAQDTITGNGILFEFDPITGYSDKGIQKLPYRISQATLLLQHDKNFLKPLLVLSQDNELYAYPRDAVSVIKDHFSTIFLYTANSETAILTGFTLKYSTENQMVVKKSWDIDLKPSKIVALGVKPQNEQVHSQGKVLYDRSVYYKYVNPNLLAVATISPDPMHHNVLSIYLIDGVTGLVVYGTSHKRAKGPVHLVHSENWLVYSYFNERFRRTELAALELYEGHLQSNSTAFSSFAVSQLPHIQSQSYILPLVPLKMAVTLTERGITNKFLLVAMSSGAVLEIPWLLLQPRFENMPCGPEESCIPYMPEIPMHPEAIINYNQTLGRIRGIEVAPARLESTSHILVHGLDIFYTRVAPSKTFDVLKEDFDHKLIVLVLSALIIATFVTKKLAARKALKQAWK
ncbi:ER membrane protein complex subunit 1 [Sitophilus oryzae]|uniref:ER membrane protein complex subunit 1 n=1 Tax=Sitophilus oryzae TaxID=7048 RepID=A0A6J2XT19_SITOR|nr:ER membrane protein complex subunit 1 [Sitophilus oryzae]